MAVGKTGINRRHIMRDLLIDLGLPDREYPKSDGGLGVQPADLQQRETAPQDIL